MLCHFQCRGFLHLFIDFSSRHMIKFMLLFSSFQFSRSVVSALAGRYAKLLTNTPPNCQHHQKQGKYEKLSQSRDYIHITEYSVQFSSVAQSCPTLCDPMNCSTPGLPVHHQLLGFTQTHVHRVGDAIQPSHPLLSPSPPAHSQHQGLFQWVNSSHEVDKVLEFQL